MIDIHYSHESKDYTISFFKEDLNNFSSAQFAKQLELEEVMNNFSFFNVIIQSCTSVQNLLKELPKLCISPTIKSIHIQNSSDEDLYVILDNFLCLEILTVKTKKDFSLYNKKIRSNLKILNIESKSFNTGLETIEIALTELVSLYINTESLNYYPTNSRFLQWMLKLKFLYLKGILKEVTNLDGLVHCKDLNRIYIENSKISEIYNLLRNKERLEDIEIVNADLKGHQELNLKSTNCYLLNLSKNKMETLSLYFGSSKSEAILDVSNNPNLKKITAIGISSIRVKRNSEIFNLYNAEQYSDIITINY